MKGKTIELVTVGVSGLMYVYSIFIYVCKCVPVCGMDVRNDLGDKLQVTTTIIEVDAE